MGICDNGRKQKQPFYDELSGVEQTLNAQLIVGREYVEKTLSNNVRINMLLHNVNSL